MCVSQSAGCLRLCFSLISLEQQPPLYFCKNPSFSTLNVGLTRFPEETAQKGSLNSSCPPQSSCLETKPRLLPRLTGRWLRIRCLRWAWHRTRYASHTAIPSSAASVSFAPGPMWTVPGGGLVALLHVSGHLLVFGPQMHLYEQENFQGRAIEITAECVNVCDVGMDKVRSLRVECGP